MRTVAHLLAAKEPQYNQIDANVSVLEALSLLNQGGFGHLIVFKDNKFAGIFTHQDYVNKVLLRDKSAHIILVREAMQRELPNVSSDDTAEHCTMIMNSFKTHFLPVFDEFDFKGIITFNDLVSEALDDKDLKPLMHDVIKRHWVGEQHAPLKYGHVGFWSRNEIQ